MLNSGNMRLVGSAQLRAVLAVVFFLVSSLQGTLFASASSFGEVNAKDIDHHQMVKDAVAGVHDHSQAADSASLADEHHGDKSMSDGNCEVHCAPASVVPVNDANFAQAVARCFARSIAPILVDGVYAESIRPPRQLI